MSLHIHPNYGKKYICRYLRVDIGKIENRTYNCIKLFLLRQNKLIKNKPMRVKCVHTSLEKSK